MGLVHIAETSCTQDKQCHSNHHQHYPHPPLYPISYQGGAIIGVFMIQALKGALWGILGLLLNAPYKIDSMMGMRLMMIYF
jgi:hypothetical protein